MTTPRTLNSSSGEYLDALSVHYFGKKCDDISTKYTWLSHHWYIITFKEAALPTTLSIKEFMKKYKLRMMLVRP